MPVNFSYIPLSQTNLQLHKTNNHRDLHKTSFLLLTFFVISFYIMGAIEEKSCYTAIVFGYVFFLNIWMPFDLNEELLLPCSL